MFLVLLQNQRNTYNTRGIKQNDKLVLPKKEKTNEIYDAYDRRREIQLNFFRCLFEL